MEEEINVRIFNVETGKYIDHQVYKYIPRTKNTFTHPTNSLSDTLIHKQNKNNHHKKSPDTEKDIAKSTNYFAMLDTVEASVIHTNSIATNHQMNITPTPLLGTVVDPYIREESHIPPTKIQGDGQMSCHCNASPTFQ